MSTYSYSGTIQKVTVATTGKFQIAAYGAQGGESGTAGYPEHGGRGAAITGIFDLTAGEKLEIIVGGVGGSMSRGAGGGGGTFVLANIGAGGAYVPLEVAGGGGGGSGNYSGGAGSATTTGNGQGGTAPHSNNAGGGAGVQSSGTSGPGYNGVGSGGQGGSNGSGGYRGGAGGTSPNEPSGGQGGFGGGGGGSNFAGGGGGGGYSGGRGGFNRVSISGGGTSFVSPTGVRTAAVDGANGGNGRVVITAAPPVASQDVSTSDQLNAAIFRLNGGAGSYTINVTGNLSLTGSLIPLQLGAGGSLTINGNGFSIDGGGTYGGLMVTPTSATPGTNAVAINALAIDNTVQTGGAGQNDFAAGGGGAGLGGGLFVGAGAAVTLTGVSFNGDKAVGGAGGSFNGNGMGAGGSLNGTPLAGDQGGAGETSGSQGGKAGGFGGGGGAGFGAGTSAFGGGAGVSYQYYQSTPGGFGGGGSPGGDPNTANPGGAGGGLGAGGAVFVQAGGSLTIAGGDPTSGATIAGGSVVGGAGGTGSRPGGAGSALGSGIFLQGNQSVTLAPAAGQTQTIADVIADQPGSSGLIIGGAGTVKLTGANTYAGGTYLEGGTAAAGNVGAFGTGTIHAVDPTIEYSVSGTYSNPIELDVGSPASSDPTTFKVDSGVSATITGAITTGSGTNAMGQTIDPNQPIVVSGPGTLTLAAANTYAGGTYLERGTVIAGNVGAFGTGTIHAVDPTIEYSVSGTYSNPIELDVGSPASSDPTTFKVDSGVSATITGAITTGSGTNAMGQTIDPNQPIVVSGPGTLTLAAANTYSGGTTISGSLTATHVDSTSSVDALGSGTVTLDGGTLTLDLPANAQTPSTPDFLTDAMAVTANGGTLDGGLALGAASAIDITRGISGTGPLTLTDGAFVLDGDNSGFSGATTITGTSAHPTFVLASGTNALSSASAYTLNGNATLGLLASGTTSRTIGSLAGAGTVTAIGQTGDVATLITGGDGSSTAYSGLIEDGQASFNSSAIVALTKTGGGTFTLSGANSYSGGTTIAAGTLDLASATAAGSGPITFAGSPGGYKVTLSLDIAAQPASGGTFGNVIASFGADDQIDLKGLAYSGTQQVTPINVVNNTISIVESGSTENFNLSNPGAATFCAKSDGQGGTLVGIMPTQVFSYTGSVQAYTVQTTGNYTLTAYGAQGGSGGGAGGKGAEEGGDFDLTAGTRLEIVAGGAGADNGQAGGGGGTFVLVDTGPNGSFVPLVVAGGGGGGYASGSRSGGAGTVGSPGSGAGGGSGNNTSGGGGAGVNGNGASAGSQIYGGGGGFNGSGAYAGGTGHNGAGGFGGGGSGGANGSGGGGGYTGGDGGNSGSGAGGTSFLGTLADSFGTVQVAGVNAGNGFVTLQRHDVVCFCTGVRILTARGEVAVEDLGVGDLAVTAAGEHRPVRWIGRQEVDCASHPGPAEVMPVRVAAGALGPCRPSRDLWVSPGHALCLDVLGEVLVPASSLVNDATIAQVDVETVTYWHVELDTHDVLLADGQPAESYMDCGNRAFFGTGEGAVDPDRAAATPADYCRPFHPDGALVTAVRGQIRVRAQKLGWRVAETVDDDLHLVADGVAIRPTRAGDMARFVVPASAKDVRLVSRTFVPHHVGDSADGRQLGVMLQALAIDDGLGVRRDVAFDDPLLCVGFHQPEAGFRWTAGRALLPAALWDGCRDVFFLQLTVTSHGLPAWVAPDGLALPEAPATDETHPRGLRLVHTA